MGGHHHHQEQQQQHAVVVLVESEKEEKPSLLLLQEEEGEEEEEVQERKNHVLRNKTARVIDGPGTTMRTLGKSGGFKSEGFKGSGVVSPKSVITRFMSPGSSSSSSMERGVIGAGGRGGGAARALLESTSSSGGGGTGQCKWLPPLHDRGYSISDGEISDSDSTSVLESTSTTGSSSREFAKSGPLESLPETHSLALDAVRSPKFLTSAGAAAGGVPSSSSSGKGSIMSSSCRRELGNEINGVVVCSEFSSSRRQGVVYSANPPAALTASIDAAASTTVSMKLMQTTTAAAASVVEIDDRSSTQCRPDWVQAAAATTSTSNDDEHSAAKNFDKKKKLAYLRRNHPTAGIGPNKEAPAVVPPQTRLQGMRISASAAAATDTASATEKSSDDNAKPKQAPPQQTQGPQATCSASMGMILAYPGTPQRLFPAAVGSPRAAAGNGNGFYSPVSSSDPKGASKASSSASRFHQGFFPGLVLNPILLKPTPSKWDDAEKWITSPGHHHESPATAAASHSSHQQLLNHHHHHEPILTGRRHSIAGPAATDQGLPQSCDGACASPEYSTSNAEKLLSPRSNIEASGIGKGQITRQVPAPITATTTQKKRSKTLSFGDLSKRFDLSRAVSGPGKSNSNSQGTQEVSLFEENRQADDHHHDHQMMMMMPKHLSSDQDVAAQSTSFRRSVASGTSAVEGGSGSSPNFPHQQLPVISSVHESKFPKCTHACDISTNEQGSSAPSSSFDSCTKDDFCSTLIDVQIPKHGRSVSMREIGTDPSTPPTLHTPQPSLGHRDMATQMTPVESQKTSLCTTPKFLTSPTRNDTNNMMPAAAAAACLLVTTPPLSSLSAKSSLQQQQLPGLDLLELDSCHRAKIELCKLGCGGDDEELRIDQNPITCNDDHTPQEDDIELLERTASLRQYDLGDMERGIRASRANTWEQTELAKCTARYNQKEEKIVAWEALKKSKAETELKKMELKIEKMRVHAIEKMQSRVAAVSQNAEQMRAAAESNHIKKAAKVSARVQQIISTGQFPISHNSFRCCFS